MNLPLVGWAGPTQDWLTDTALSLIRGQNLDLTTAGIAEVYVLVLTDLHRNCTMNSTTSRTSKITMGKTIQMSITNILTTIMINMEISKRSVIVRTHSLIMSMTLCLVLKSSTIQLVVEMNHLSIMTLTTTTLTLASMRRKVDMLLMNSLMRTRRESSVKEKKATVIPVLHSKKAIIPLLLNSKNDQHKTIPSEVVHLMTRDMKPSNPTNSLMIVGEKAPKIFSFFLTPVLLL